MNELNVTARIIIARHGNTFEKHETPRRVGAMTDIPLTSTGREQAKNIGKYLKNNNLIPDMVFSSPLKRTIDTAMNALEECNCRLRIQKREFLKEIDYGVDENKTDAEVITRIGEESLLAWDKSAIIPQGWNVNIEQIESGWLELASIAKNNSCNVFAVTSNGIARFSPVILSESTKAEFLADNKIKISTGALCIFEFSQIGNLSGNWQVKLWNYRHFE